MVGRVLQRDPRKPLPMIHSAVVTGAWVGALLSVLMTVWLFVANRVPTLEPYAFERNIATGIAALLIGALPFFRFRRSARALFLSGVTTWVIVSLCYAVWSLYFERLADQVSVFRLFVMGTVVYGLAAAVVWVASVIRSLRRTEIVASTPHRPLTHQ